MLSWCKERCPALRFERPSRPFGQTLTSSMAQEPFSSHSDNSDATLRVPATATLAEPTVRVPQNLPSEDVDSPSAPDSDATILVGSGVPADVPVAELLANAKPIVVPARQLPLGILAAGTVICGDCVVRETVRPHETMLGGLYDCDAPEGRVMVKIAAPEHAPREELWERLPTLRHPALLHNHRVTREQGFFAEVQEFCEAGTLDDCIPRAGKAPLSWEQIERGVVAPFLSGIAYLHANGIVHRDIKPKNLYLRKVNGKVALVIADFDISSVIQSDRTSRDTPRGAGTHFYMAPEAFPRFVDPSAGRAAAIVSPASDFYSLGVLLVELLLGTTALHSGRWSDIYDFYMAGGRIEIPGDIPPRGRQLIQGLLIRNRRTRWGVAEVRRWLDNQITNEDEKRIREDSGYELVQRAARPYNVFASSPTDIHGLAQAMLDEPGIAEDELMSGDVLINWLGELDMKLAREIRRDKETWSQYPRVAYLCAMLRLDPTLPFPLSPGLNIAAWGEWEEKIEGWLKDKKIELSLVVSRSTLMKLEAWLRLKSDPNLLAANAVADLRTAWWDGKQGILNPLDVRAAWEEMRWLIDPLRPFHITSQIAVRTPAELARACYGRQADWQNGIPSVYRAALIKWQEGLLGAWLRQRTRDENGQVSPVVAQIEMLRHKKTMATEALWETVLHLLDPKLPPVRLRFTPGAMGQGLLLEWGARVERRVTYEALSPGLPFGAWKIVDAPPGFHIKPSEISLRNGDVTVILDSRNGLEAGSAGCTTISLHPGGTCTLEAPLSVSYRIKLPDAQRNNFIRNGALIGAGLAGGARLVAWLCTGTEWVPPEERRTEQTSTNGGATSEGAPTTTTRTPDTPDTGEELPPIGYLGAGMAITLGAVVAFYVWLNALRHYAQR